MTSETVKLYDVNNNLLKVIEIPKRLPEQAPRRIIVEGKKYVEGGPGSFYGFGEFAEVEKDA